MKIVNSENTEVGSINLSGSEEKRVIDLGVIERVHKDNHSASKRFFVRSPLGGYPGILVENELDLVEYF